jgi:hypothetical protein
MYVAPFRLKEMMILIAYSYFSFAQRIFSGLPGARASGRLRHQIRSVST